GTTSWGTLRSKDGDKATYFFRGSAVDESAEAEHQASAGEIVITDAMNLLLRDAIQTRPLGSFHRFTRFLVELPPYTPIIFPPVDLEISRIFMPEAVIARDIRGEFRQIVNLFMRYPELPNEKLEDFLHIIFDLQKKYGGLISRLDFGDKGSNMLVLWGAPVTHENDIGRALNFILELRSRVDFRITTGITYYVAHAGYLGSAMYEDYTCYGWGINLASRFMMSAPDGQIWVDDRIARRVSTRFEMENIGAQRFKGFSTEQRVHVLHGRRHEAELIYEGELIGREKEMALLEDFTKPLWMGEFAGLLQITGDAGMGKGRLVYEFRQSAIFGNNMALWALCQADQILRQSFNPFRNWLFRYFGFSSSNTSHERKQLFESKLQNLIDSTPDVELAQELDRLRSVLGALAELFWTDSLYEQLDAEGRYNSTLLALITFIKAESLRQPLILFLEDAQYMDEDTRNFLPRLKRSLRVGRESHPVAIIANVRLQGSSLLDDDLVDERIDLKGLTAEEGARQIEILLGGVPAVELVRRVMERSEGNPYFVEQFIRYMQDENLIEISKLGWNQVRRIRDFF
ncbi:MAG TPA: AAA family ATPase, partial [Anaerolineales bacterium]|nr:AAA family ATPase [Anaerolineales bacterium]